MQKPFAMGLKILTMQFLFKVVIVPEYREHQRKPAIPETAERIQYRILIRDLWEILGLLFDMRTEL